MLSSAEARVKLEQCGVDRPFVDPALSNSPRVYRTFLQRAEAGGLIEYRLTPVVEQVGVLQLPKRVECTDLFWMHAGVTAGFAMLATCHLLLAVCSVTLNVLQHVLMT